LDRADQAREAVADEGLTTKTKTTGAVHVHPLVKVEREARQQFAKCWNDLDLSWSYDLDSSSW
jgi:phage terminase small subunit